MTTVPMSKTRVAGRRPGDVFHRHGDEYRVVGIVRAYRELRIVTESARHGREIWY